MYCSTSSGTSVLLLKPPNAVPFHVLPVISWNGRVAISCPAGATPITQDWPQPRCAHSRALRITCGGMRWKESREMKERKEGKRR